MKTKAKIIVFNEVQLETGHYLTVVQRFAFIREIKFWLPIQETGRFFLYLADSQIIRKSWHDIVCKSDV